MDAGMIKSFAHKGLRRFFDRGSKAGVRPEHVKRLRLVLAKLNAAADVADMNFPGGDLHALRGDLEGFWSVSVSGNWRLTFRFENGDAFDVNYMDYH
jgi:proteic killer suppression protein